MLLVMPLFSCVPVFCDRDAHLLSAIFKSISDCLQLEMSSSRHIGFV